MGNRNGNNKGRSLLSQLILDSAGEGIYGIDAAGNTTFVNPAALKMLGFSASEEVRGRSVYEILLDLKGKNADEIEITPIDFALTEGETAHVNTETFYRRNGESFLVEYICVPLKEKKATCGAVITFQDITERREIETAISAARDAALESANTKAAFLANMSHEIRTPLTGILGLTELLQNTALQPEQKNLAALIKSSADSLLIIINDILDFSKIEAGKFALENVEFDLKQILKTTLQIFAVEARRKNLALSLEIAENVPLNLQGDAGRLRQVFNNLLGNAAKFTENGAIILRVETTAEIEENEVILKFSVEDSGIGIAPEVLPKLFQPFTQGDVSTTRNYGGTGLGLSICKQIAEMMGGEIGAESEVGKGSRFWFTAHFQVAENDVNFDRLTRRRGDTRTKDKNRESRIKNQKSKIENRRSKILVVEDNPINQQVTCGFLREIGFVGEIANNGLEGLEKFKTENFDLILMDCQMPELDGYETTRAIRKLENGAKPIKIVAMTGHFGQNERARCLAAGMDDYLLKPFSLAQFRFILQANLPAAFAENEVETEFADEIPAHFLAEVLEAETLAALLRIEENGEPNFIVEMLQLYLEHSEKLFEKFHAAFETENFTQIAEVAHSLKGSSSSLGLTEMFALSDKLEQSAKHRNRYRVTDNFLNLQTEFERIGKLWQTAILKI